MRRDRAFRRWVIVIALTVLTTTGWASAAYYFADGRAQEAQRADTAEQVTEQIAEPAQTLADRVEAACRAEDDDPERDALRADGLCEQADQTRQAIEDAPVGTPNATTTLRGPVGPPPSLLQVRAAVQLEIGAALEAVCDGSCEGADGSDGSDGEDGTDGADSTVAGPDGRPGADSTTPGPPGRDGTDGRDGRPGADAPRITSFACAGFAPQTLTIGLSDGTSYTAECTLIDPIEPEPEPTPSQ